jgi:tetratricopeptide (TPR) repeat protein
VQQLKILTLAAAVLLVLPVSPSAKLTYRAFPKTVYFDEFEAGTGTAEMATFASMLVRLRLQPEPDLNVVRSSVDLLCRDAADSLQLKRGSIGDPLQKHFLVKGSVTHSGSTSQLTLQYTVSQIEDCQVKLVPVDEGARKFVPGEALSELNLVADRIAARLAEAASDRISIRIESRDDRLKTDLALAFDDSSVFRPTSSKDASYIVDIRRSGRTIHFEITGPEVKDVGDSSLGGKKSSIPSFADIEGAEFVVRRAETLEARRRVGVIGPLDRWKTEDLIEKARTSSDPEAVAAILDGRKGLTAQGEMLLADAMAARGQPTSAAEAYDRAAAKLVGDALSGAMSKAAAQWKAAGHDDFALQRWNTLAALERSAGGLTPDTAVHISTVSIDKRAAWMLLLEAARGANGEEPVHSEWDRLMNSMELNNKPEERDAACEATQGRNMHALLGICIHARGMARWQKQERSEAAELFGASVVELLAAQPWAETLASDFAFQAANAWSWDPGARNRAIEAARQALRLRISVDGPEHQRTGDSFQQLGSMLLRDRQFEEARMHLEQALAIRTRSQSRFRERGETESSLANLLSSLGGRRNLEESERHYKGAIAAFIEANEPADSAGAHRAYASMLLDQGRYGDAVSEYREALNFYSEKEPGGVNAANVMSWISECLAEEGDFDAAVRLARQSLDLRPDTNKENDAARSTGHGQLGLVYLYSGQYVDALNEFTAALTLRLQRPRSAAQGGVEKHNLALAKEYIGRYSEAETDYRDSLSIYQRDYEKGSLEAAMQQLRLANVLTLTGRYREAADALKDSTDIVQNAYPSPSNYFTIAQRLRAELLLATGDLDKAFALASEAVSIREAEEKESKWRLSTYFLQLGRILLEQHRESDAAEKFNQVKALWVGLGRVDHPDVATAEWGLGLVAGAADRLDEMETHCQRSLVIATLAAAPSPLGASEARACLADVASRRGLIDLAVSEQKQALDSFTNAVPRPHPQAAKLAERYAELLETRGDSAMGQAMRERAQKMRTEHNSLEKAN